jgi:ABC-type nickel/cobalt efflux system permease component RcnA
MDLQRTLYAVIARFARFLLIFAALWLPVQTMAGLAMPLCQHGEDRTSVVAVHHGDDASAMPCHEAMADEQAAHQDGCDNCGVCHLASAGFLPSADVAAGLMPVGHRYALPAVLAPRSHIAEPPQHPPRDAA